MARPLVGDRPMTAAERMRRYRAKRTSPPAVTPAPVTATAPASDGPTIPVRQLIEAPDRVIHWLRDQISYRDMVALRLVVDQALRDAANQTPAENKVDDVDDEL
jgi:hypothetical protein